MLRHKNTNRVYNHWRLANRKNKPPMRALIEPSAIAGALGGTVLIHRPEIRDPNYYFQLAGTRFCAMVGRELSGHAVQTLASGIDSKTIIEGLTAVEQEHTVFICEFAGITASGKSLPIEAIFMPLADEVPSIIGAIEPLVQPVWLGIEPVIMLQVAHLRMMDMDKELFALTNRPAIPFPPRLDGFGSQRPSRQKPALAVITGRATERQPSNNRSFEVLNGGKTDPF